MDKEMLDKVSEGYKALRDIFNAAENVEPYSFAELSNPNNGFVEAMNGLYEILEANGRG
jgi:hypothetical protein